MPDFFLSDREKILRRTFKMAINKGCCQQQGFHNYSRWAKGKSESQIMAHINASQPIPEMEHTL